LRHADPAGGVDEPVVVLVPSVPATAEAAAVIRLTAFVKGHVQEVGYRWWIRARALELGLTGSATNLDDGRVQVVAEGPEPACRALLQLLPKGPGKVDFVAERWDQPRGEAGFVER
jgi:acylphosphatase